MRAFIYKPAKTAVQSGQANSKEWILEFEAEQPPYVESLMGWVSSCNTLRQVRLRFASKREALAYAKREGIEFTVMESQDRVIRPVSYADNFHYNRRENWTH